MGMERAIEKLAPLAIAFVFVGIAIAIGAVVIGEIADMDVVDEEENSTAYDTIQAALDALDTLGSFLTVLAVVAVASLIFLLLKVFGNTASNNGSMM